MGEVYRPPVRWKHPRVSAGSHVFVLGWKGIRLQNIGIFHEPNPFTALSAWLPSNRWLALPADDDSGAGRHSPGFTRHSRACERPRAVRVPHAIPEMPGHTKPQPILLFVKTSVCPRRVPLYFWPGRNLHFLHMFISAIYNAVALYLDEYPMHSEERKKVRADEFKTSFEICCYRQNYRLYRKKQIELNLYLKTTRMNVVMK